MERTTKALVAEISAAIIVHNALCAILAGCFFQDRAVFAGLFVGMASAILMVVHMAFCLERSIDTGDFSAANKKTVVGSVIRNFCYLILLLVILWKFSDKINVLAVVIGALGLKTGAYMQPALHRLFHKRT